MRHLALAAFFAVLGVGCGAAEEAPKAPVDDGKCDLTADSLVGKSFIHRKKNEAGSWEENKRARATFVDEAGKTKVKYSVSSLSSIYTYSCDKKSDTELVCLQDDPDYVEFCRSLWANTGSCEAGPLAQVLGLDANAPDEKVVATVKRVNEEVKKLNEADLAKMKAGYNSPAVQLRGILKVKVKNTKDECRLTMTDLYETFSNGSRQEYENLIGAGQFIKSSKPYVFEDCRDFANLVVQPADKTGMKPGETQIEWSAGTAGVFTYVGPESQKAADGCTYSMDTFFDYEPIGTAVPVVPDASGKLNWSFTRTISPKGKTVGHMYRYKACGGKPAERIDVSCQMVSVQ